MTRTLDGSEFSSRSLLRILVLACQALTIALTWPLWQVRASPLPPNLPLVQALPDFPCGALLLATLAVVVVTPRVGIALHFGALALAIALDETRFQPQVLSLALLLLATLPGAGMRLLGSGHLIALWLWSGLHKLVSPAYLAHAGDLVTQRFTSLPEPLARALALAVAIVEVALAVLALFTRTRPLARSLGTAMHLAVLAWLSPLVLDWNPSVWPWNVALAFSAWILLGGDAPPFAGAWRAAPRWARAAVLFELIAPVGYQAGLWPAPLAHALYCMSTPHATWLHRDGGVSHLRDLPELNVFLPGTYHALAAAFRAQAQPGDRLVIVEMRPLLRALGWTETLVRKE